MKQNTMRKQNPPLGQVLYLKDYIPAEQAAVAVEKTQFDGGAAYVHPVGQCVLVHAEPSLFGIVPIIAQTVPQADIPTGETCAFFEHSPFF